LFQFNKFRTENELKKVVGKTLSSGIRGLVKHNDSYRSRTTGIVKYLSLVTVQNSIYRCLSTDAINDTDNYR